MLPVISGMHTVRTHGSCQIFKRWYVYTYACICMYQCVAYLLHSRYDLEGQVHIVRDSVCAHVQQQHQWAAQQEQQQKSKHESVYT